MCAWSNTPLFFSHGFSGFARCLRLARLVGIVLGLPPSSALKLVEFAVVRLPCVVWPIWWELSFVAHASSSSQALSSAGSLSLVEHSAATLPWLFSHLLEVFIFLQ